MNTQMNECKETQSENTQLKQTLVFCVGLWVWKQQPVSWFIHKNCFVELYTAPPLLNADRGRKGKRDNEGLQMKWVQLCNQSTFSEKESASLAKNLNWITEPAFWWERTLPLASHFYLSSSCLPSLFQEATGLFSLTGSGMGIYFIMIKCILHAYSFNKPLLSVCSVPSNMLVEWNTIVHRNIHWWSTKYQALF